MPLSTDKPENAPAPRPVVTQTPVERAHTAQYRVVSAVVAHMLTAQVEALLAEGWQLQGGVCTGEFHDPARGQRVPGLHQALVKL
jgi:hypothetical protein